MVSRRSICSGSTARRGVGRAAHAETKRNPPRRRNLSPKSRADASRAAAHFADPRETEIKRQAMFAQATCFLRGAVAPRQCRHSKLRLRRPSRAARPTRAAGRALDLRARRAEAELPLGGQQDRRREPPFAGWVARSLGARGQNAQSAVEMSHERFDLRLESTRRGATPPNRRWPSFSRASRRCVRTSAAPGSTTASTSAIPSDRDGREFPRRRKPTVKRPSRRSERRSTSRPILARTATRVFQRALDKALSGTRTARPRA